MTKTFLLGSLLFLCGCNNYYVLTCTENGKVTYNGLIRDNFLTGTWEAETNKRVRIGSNSTCTIEYK